MDNLRKDEEPGSEEAGKKGGKETNGGEEPNMNHRIKAIAEAIGLQKVRASSAKTMVIHEMHFMECSGPSRCTTKRNSWMILTRMGSYSSMYTRNHVRKM